MVWRNEVDLVLLTDYFTGILCFIVLFTNISGFVIEQAVRVTHPSNTPEKYTKNVKLTDLTWFPHLDLSLLELPYFKLIRMVNLSEEVLK